jgi:hypothetical protein
MLSDDRPDSIPVVVASGRGANRTTETHDITRPPRVDLPGASQRVHWRQPRAAAIGVGASSPARVSACAGGVSFIRYHLSERT